MRVILQRVTNASVKTEGEVVGQIGRGWLVLLGVKDGDGAQDVSYLAEKTAYLRAFPDAEGKMNLSVLDVVGEALVVSQFTLYGDCRKGRRPGFTDAAAPKVADELYQSYVNELRALGLKVATGKFQAHMEVSLVNDGPVTFMIDSAKAF